MEQDVDTNYRAVCSSCLCSDRDLFSLNAIQQVYQIFRLLMHDFAGNRYGESVLEIEHYVCWECLALMKRFLRFKSQVHSAQEHLRILAMSRSQESVDHTYMSQSLSCLEVTTKVEYDKIYFDYTQDEWPQPFIITTSSGIKSEQYDVAQAVRDNINLDIDEHILEVPEMVLENPVTGVMSHIVVGTDALVSPADTYKTELRVGPIETQNIETVILKKPKIETDKTLGYTAEYLTEAQMLEVREALKQKVQYASSVYKCELCIIGFYTQQQVEDHFVSEHRAKPGRTACKVCYVYVDDSCLVSHTDSHYMRYTCKFCGQHEHSTKLMALHVGTHARAAPPPACLQYDPGKSKKKSDKDKKSSKPPPKSGELRKLLSKTTIEGYQCLECDMFFKNSRARKNHVARCHREGLQCDHCKKRFVNRTTLATHLRLHEGPLPREECPICHKMVRVMQLKYHIQRHENTCRYECSDCNKVFCHLATYQAHLKYSRAHATDSVLKLSSRPATTTSKDTRTHPYECIVCNKVFCHLATHQAHLKYSRAHATDSVLKYPCPMCNKGYPTKEAMQDHFNYQHLGKTSHKCPVCDKPIASRANVEKHMMRIHGQKKEKPRSHVCQTCGKGFTDKKALNQHEVIHSGERPLSCDICQQTFKQKASLYTHRKRVHKVFPAKRVVEYMENKPDGH